MVLYNYEIRQTGEKWMMTWGSQFPFFARSSSPFQWRDFILWAGRNPFRTPRTRFKTPSPKRLNSFQKALSQNLNPSPPPNIKLDPFKKTLLTPPLSRSSSFCGRLNGFAVNYWSFPNKRSPSPILYWTLPGVTCTQAWSHSYIFYRSLPDGTHM